ncbi:LacI family DNA-binding transcriptional regulator [Limosilactobacillus difficilis]|uniref:LacI family DNA-binding transcriptional regulator n=1 Tax=Limosilactobacillus difficilis TaxID=2991838 RepID=UPI0024B95C4A|nr:LacI family DNA-binding transcriptional regulator [Limosilactobacillus difficilis]
MKATIKDIAKMTGLSTATVSRVLANKEGTFKQSTAQRVRDAANKLGYQRNVAAAELAANAVSTIAVIINNTETNFWLRVLDGIQDEANRQHRQVMIFYAGNNNEQMLDQAINAAVERKTAAILLVATKVNDRQLATIENTRVPYRFISIYENRESARPFISSDNVKIGQLATQYCLDRGHRQIGMVGIDKSSTGRERLLGYQEMMTKARLSIAPGWVQYGDYSLQNGKDIFARIADLGLTAVIASSDMVGAGLIISAKQAGVKVPDELSIISIDGTMICDVTTPQLTSVTQDFYRMGMQSVKDLLDNTKNSDHQFVPVQITERASVQKLN